MSSSSNNINYSIVIPHKNTPELLRRCLKSIPRRKDIQIIVVDDNSNPTIVNFANFPGDDEDGVDVFFSEKKGGGAGFARNIGLDKVKGKWVFFSDSDDFFNENFLIEADRYCKSNYDIIYFSVNCVMSDNIKLKGQRKALYNLEEYYRLSLIDEKKAEAKYRYSFTEPWAKMFRTDLIIKNKILFEETLVANDVMFSVQSGHYAKQIFITNAKIYTITQRKGSLSHNYAGTYDKLKTRIEVATRVSLFFKKNRIQTEVSALRGLIVVLIKKYPHMFLVQLVCLKKNDIKLVPLLREIFRI